MDFLTDEQFLPEKCVSILKSRMKCSLCPSTFVGCFNLTNHLKRKHRVEIKITCKLCWKIFFVPIVYHKHLLDHGHVPGVTGELLDVLRNGYVTNWQRWKISRQKRLLEEQKQQHLPQEQGKQTENIKQSAQSRNSDEPEKLENPCVPNEENVCERSKISCSRCDETFETREGFFIHGPNHLRIDSRINCFKCTNFFIRPEDYFGHSCLLPKNSLEPAPSLEFESDQPPSPICFEDSLPATPEFIELDDVSPGQPLPPSAPSPKYSEALIDPEDSMPYSLIFPDESPAQEADSSDVDGPVILNVCSITPEPENSFECGICNVNSHPHSFKTQNKLAIHSASHLQIDARIHCSKCSVYFVRAENYFGHSCLYPEAMLEPAQSPPELIPDSPDQPSSPNCSEDSKKNTKRRIIHKCDLCSERFNRKTKYIKHQLTHHPEVKDTLCTICAQKFPTPIEKQEHIRTQHSWKLRRPPSTICEICGKTLRKHHLKEHMETIHSQANVSCEDCGKVCKSVTQLKKHKLIHLPEKAKNCPFCPYRCSVTAAKLLHLAWKHLGPHGFQELDLEPGMETPFRCPDCPKEYTTQVALDEHRIFHGKRTYKCKKCPWKCFTNYHLHAHNVAFHSLGANNIVKPVPWLCKFCGESSGNRWELYVHEIKCPERRNTGLDLPKPATVRQEAAGPADSALNYIRKTDEGWQCEQCNKISKTKADVLYHYRAAHSGSYLYICEVCGRGTNSKSNMKVHMRSHEGVFECGPCGQRFEKSKELQVHKEEVHRVSTTNGKSSVTVGSKCRSRTDCKLVEALVGLDGDEGYKVALMRK